jgi:hypothetical protein
VEERNVVGERAPASRDSVVEVREELRDFSDLGKGDTSGETVLENEKNIGTMFFAHSRVRRKGEGFARS